jgi:hypothetical protein
LICIYNSENQINLLYKEFLVFKFIKYKVAVHGYINETSDIFLSYKALLELSFEETDNIADNFFFFKQNYYLGDVLIDLWFDTIEVPIGIIIF